MHSFQCTMHNAQCTIAVCACGARMSIRTLQIVLTTRFEHLPGCYAVLQTYLSALCSLPEMGNLNALRSDNIAEGDTFIVHCELCIVH